MVQPKRHTNRQFSDHVTFRTISGLPRVDATELLHMYIESGYLETNHHGRIEYICGVTM